jgi:hypothetical protein
MNAAPTPPYAPAKSLLFPPTTDAYGARLALVFGNESKTGACPFYGQACFHCDIGAGEGVFTPALNYQRLQFFRDHYGDVLRGLRHLVLYNSGSLLNPHELSSDTLNHLLAFARSLAGCSLISMDSREQFVQTTIMGQVRAGLRLDQRLRITLGLETQDDHVRGVVLNKHMTRAGMARAFAVLGQHSPQVGAALNILFQPPGISPSDAVPESTKTFQYGLELSREFGVPVDFNFHPYYRSVIGSKHFPAHTRGRSEDAKAAIAEGRRLIEQSGSDSKIYVGWYDEGHDQDQGRRASDARDHLAGFLEFNRTQNPTCLQSKHAVHAFQTSPSRLV